MEGVLDKDQRLDEGRVETEDGKLNYEDSSDDEEVKLLPHRKVPMSLIRRGRISEMCRRCRTLSGNNGCLRRSLFMGLGRSGIGRGDLQWYSSRLGLWTQKPQGV